MTLAETGSHPSRPWLEGFRQQRLRDPVHGLIIFREGDDTDALAWTLINQPEFQRLRRIRQLGFSEFVFPGATHTRFAHSIGVYQTARQLLTVVRRLLGADYDEDRARVAAIAALLHDLGHGPFSHTFEGVMKSLRRPKKHERWTVEIIRGDTGIGDVLSADPTLREAVASLLEAEQPSDPYAAIVSSQFDADRLDYLRRDRLMSGIDLGRFDFDWLLDSIAIGIVTVGSADDGGDVRTIEQGFVIDRKGLSAVEGYLLGRFHLYTQLYLHKTTRGAEKMLAALLKRLAELAAGGEGEKSGLPSDNALFRMMAGAEDLSSYLALDDGIVWSAVEQMRRGEDEKVEELAVRLFERRLYKCVDIGGWSEVRGGTRTARFHEKSQQLRNENPYSVLVDRTTATAYSFSNYDSAGALQNVMIKTAPDADDVRDVTELSAAIKAIDKKPLYRVYARDDDTLTALNAIREELDR